MLIVKSIFDRFISLAIILFSLPFTIPFTIWLWYWHGENPFFLQIRIGKERKPFRIVKFKTEGLKKSYWNSKILYSIRNVHFDEFPQLINVLIGHMSLVGPRPHIPEHVDKYEQWQKKRLEVKPGITCLRQIIHQGVKLSFNQYIEEDIRYIENQSFMLDLKILIKTIYMLTNRITQDF